jgi:hypothetical protein
MTAPPAGRARWIVRFQDPEQRSRAFIASGHTAFEAHQSAAANSRFRVPSFGECRVRRIGK